MGRTDVKFLVQCLAYNYHLVNGGNYSVGKCSPNAGAGGRTERDGTKGCKTVGCFRGTKKPGEEGRRELTKTKNKYHFHLYNSALISSYLPNLENPSFSLQFVNNFTPKLICSVGMHIFSNLSTTKSLLPQDSTVLILSLSKLLQVWLFPVVLILKRK